MPHALGRIIDANANRAREALRCLEDLARFSLNDPALAADLKSLRHDLRGVLDDTGVDAASLLAWRDTPGDVGTSIKAGDENARSNPADIAAANAKRLTEALRSLEECAKAARHDQSAPTAAPTLESLRYRAYELEKRLRLALGTGRARQWALCVLITESLCAHHPWEEVAEQAIEGGADCLQLREKALDDRTLLARANRLVALARAATTDATENARAAVIINDRIDIALLAGADGVHLGQDDLSVTDARRIAGSSLLVGVSTSTIEEAHTAAAAGADYCGVGPMFATTTKDKPRLAGPAYLAAYLHDPRTARLPHLAIGGITPENQPQLVKVGCRGVAVSSAVCAAQRPAVACRALRNGFAPTH
jgi:thiamine-phosphate pyrophosphorylase